MLQPCIHVQFTEPTENISTNFSTDHHNYISQVFMHQLGTTTLICGS